MTAIESKAVFQARAIAIGVDRPTLLLMEAQNWKTLASFGFSCSYVPGQTDDSTFKTDVLTVLFGAPVHPMAAALRRLYFESYTMAAAELKSKLERTGEDPPRKLPLPEREARFNRLASRLTGMKLVGPTEPSHALVDSIAQMIEDGTLRYIPWSECQSRDNEIVSIKRDKQWLPDARGIIKEVVSSSSSPADTSTDLKLSQALTRRGIACDMANLMDFETHEKLANLFMEELDMDPPADYAKVTVNQLQKADKEIFRLLAAKTRGGLGPDALGRRPVDTFMKEILDSTRVRVLLMPLPSGRPSPKSETPMGAPIKKAPGPPGTPGSSPRAKARAKKAAAASSPSGGIQPSPKPAAKKRDAATAFIPMPLALRGQNATNPEGKRMCFGFNLGTCKAITVGDSCDKGVHGCCKCFGNHASKDCPK